MEVDKAKYEKQLDAALKDAGAREGILIIFKGNQGDGFCSQLTPIALMQAPRILRELAESIEEQWVSIVHREVEKLKKEWTAAFEKPSSWEDLTNVMREIEKQLEAVKKAGKRNGDN
jgi:hypothetical protein